MMKMQEVLIMRPRLYVAMAISWLFFSQFYYFKSMMDLTNDYISDTIPNDIKNSNNNNWWEAIAHTDNTNTNSMMAAEAKSTEKKAAKALAVATEENRQIRSTGVALGEREREDSTLSPQNSAVRYHQERKTRVLMGIFCRESDEEYRAMFRLLFSLHPLVCSLGRYEREQHADSECRFIYTFVTGGNKENNAPTELLDDSIPILLDKGDDQVTLNIKENMEDGKSQTWLYFATTLINNEGFHFDYVGKMDTDTLIHLDDYFKFAEDNLHPYPFNVRTIAGLFHEKSRWTGKKRKIGRKRREKFFEANYIGLHLYPGGQLYILSSDLATSIVKDAKPFSSFIESERVEDHDIGTMAYVRSEGKSLNLVMLSKKAKFWNHPVKRNKEGWEEKWRNEISRVRTVLLPQNSTTPEEVEEFLSTNTNSMMAAEAKAMAAAAEEKTTSQKKEETNIHNNDNESNKNNKEEEEKEATMSKTEKTTARTDTIPHTDRPLCGGCLTASIDGGIRSCGDQMKKIMNTNKTLTLVQASAIVVESYPTTCGVVCACNNAKNYQPKKKKFPKKKK